MGSALLVHTKQIYSDLQYLPPVGYVASLRICLISEGVRQAAGLASGRSGQTTQAGGPTIVFMYRRQSLYTCILIVVE